MKKFGLLTRILVAITMGILIGMSSPEWIVKILATFNNIFGSFLGFTIPLIIFGFIAPSIGQLGKGAAKLLGITTGIAYASTILAGMIAFLTGSILFPKILNVGGLTSKFTNPEEFLVKPFFTIEIPALMNVMSALLFAFIIGIGITVQKGDALKNVMNEFQEIISKLISNIIIPLLPLHILGVFTNMTYGGQVALIMSTFIKVFTIIILLHFTMILLQYSVGTVISKKNLIVSLKNMLPAYFTALGTQSSASTIPVTLESTKKNGVSNKVADFVIPLSATIHLSGSTITLISCSMAIMYLMGQTPTLIIMFPFILMLGITMIAAPGVPGGAVMAALGILSTMLGFNETMLALMIALYLAQDSFGTACNVTGDGAIALIVDKIDSKLK